MSKRKHKTPIQLDPSKRKLLTWNMNEGNQQGASTSNTTISQLDCAETSVETSLSLSSANVPGSIKSKGSGTVESVTEHHDGKSEVCALPHHITPSEYAILLGRAKTSITIHEQCPQDSVLCQLGLITLILRPHQVPKMSKLAPPSPEPPKVPEVPAGSLKWEEHTASASQALPKQIPRGRCSLFIGHTRPHHLVFDYAPDNAENAPKGLSSRVYLCLEATIIDEPSEACLDGLKHICHHNKWKLKLVRRGYSAKTGQLSLAVCLLQSALSVPKFASEPVLRRLDYAHHMQSLMHWLHEFPMPAPLEFATSKRHDFNQLFDAVRDRHSQRGDHSITVTIQLQHPCLVPTLREYQCQAVRWMLRKEGFGEGRKEEVEVVEEEGSDSGRLHCMWSELKLPDQCLYYNYHSGQFTTKRFTQQPSFPGGILADEMGLGKTVEVLACILAHPRYPAASKQRDETSTDSEACTKSFEEGNNANTDAGSSSEGQIGHERGTSETDCVSSDSAIINVVQEMGSSMMEGTADVREETQGVRAKTEAVDQPTASTCGGMIITDARNPSQQHAEDKPAVSQPDGSDAQPTVPKTTSDSNHFAAGASCSSDGGNFGVTGATMTTPLCSSDGDSEKETKGLFGTDTPDTEPKSRGPPFEVGAKSADTERPGVVPDTSTEPKLLITDEPLKSESVNLATDSDARLDLGYQEQIAGKVPPELKPSDASIPQLPLDKITENVKCEEDLASTSTIMEEGTGIVESTPAAEAESASANSSEPQSTSRETLQEAQETLEKPTEDSVAPQKKPRRKQAPKRPTPNPYLRLKTREPPKFRFECICGVREEELDLDLTIQCQKCSGWQHCKCVNYSKQVLGNDRYLCPMCCVEQPAVPSGGTLIVSPSSICHQWIDEINRHIRTHTLNILVYQGVKKHGFLQPRMLAKRDIVITTYETLRTELNYVDLPHTNSDSGRRLRHAKRYMAVPSPLPAVEWWRVCLDEAQMVECPTAKVAEMALRLTAVNRWCVTGTPIQRDLDNLYGLFLFLGVEPYWVKSWWDNILYKPYLHGNQEPMVKALAEVLWRSAKKDVIHQINIPPQTEETHWLHFSPIETHFYKRKQEDCSKDFLLAAGRLKMDVKTRLSSLARDTVNRLMNPLLRLRQACCHPQAVRGEFVSMQRTTLTMAELLESLTLKTKVESEEAHRQLVCAFNGLAAVCIIKGETLDAIQFYRDVLQSAEEHKDRLKTDSLQRLHTMHNLQQLLSLKPEGVVPTLRDGELEKQMQEIRDAYLARAEAALQSSIDSLLPLQEKIAELKTKLSPETPWWLDGLQWVRYLGIGEELVDKIKDMLTSTTHMDSFSVVNHFSTLQGLQLVLISKMDDLEDAFKRLQAGMAQLNVEVTQELLAEAIDCHLRPFGGKPKNRCPLCRVHTVFVEYETCLFSIKQRDNLTDVDVDEDTDTMGPKVQGSWAASETERILRILLAFLRQHSADEEVLEEGGAHLEMMDMQKKEFKNMRAVWTMLCERVAAWDELKMATMRLRLREPHEPEDITSQPNVIEPGELDQQRFKLLNDRVLAQSELKKKLGQLKYLKSLASAQSDLPGDSNPEPCPICVRELGKQWTVLPCGHSFCNSCMDMMRVHRGGHRKTIRCAICRSASSIQEISYVSTEPASPQEDCTIPVKGGFSTKVEAVVRTLMHLREQDPNVKAIVFSTWVDVLIVIAKALRDNHVEFRSIGAPGDRHFKENLMDFKQEDRVTALLLPVHSGSKGLNIIEATHVLLVEPILNPASELQAVGRVHRIGQTRPTVVHRFLVRDTIEERLHAFLQANHTSASLNNLEGETGSLTLADLKRLFTDESVAPGSQVAESFDMTDDE